MFNIPQQFTAGDRISWTEQLPDYQPGVDILSCFIRGQGSLDLTGVPDGDSWIFAITEAQSNSLKAGKYNAMFTVYVNGYGRKTLDVVGIQVSANLAEAVEIDNRYDEEIELELVNEAIANCLSGGVAEYEIGDRRIRYQDIEGLFKRQRYLQTRLAKRMNRGSIGGRNVGVRF